MEHGVTPLWVAKDRTASLIDRAFWARVDDMPWKDITDGKEIVIRGEYRHLEVWKCVPSSERHCLISEGARHCGSIHVDWFVPALCLPQREPVHVEDLVLQSATGESVPVYVPSRGSGRAGRHMWVSADDRARWRGLICEKTSLRAAPAEEDDDVITFAEQEIDRNCRVGRRAGSSATAGPFAILISRPAASRCPACRSSAPRDPMRITRLRL
ncbi:hypothetical protein [Streptomyces sp. DW26H14]|uniref:hypothetical protein n=1 Tax=Streptomyces sp. DW26H14 TaxID=3435395 RepID=UPI00403D9675